MPSSAQNFQYVSQKRNYMQTERKQYQVKLQIIRLLKGTSAASTLGQGVHVHLCIYVHIKL